MAGKARNIQRSTDSHEGATYNRPGRKHRFKSGTSNVEPAAAKAMAGRLFNVERKAQKGR